MTREDILEMCGNESVFERAERILSQGRLREINIDSDPDGATISAVADGSHGEEYDLFIRYDSESDTIIDDDCSCPAAYNYFGLCKHRAALALYWLGQMKKERGGAPGKSCTWTDQAMRELIQTCSRKNRLRMQRPEGDIRLEPTLVDEGGYYGDRKHLHLTFRIGNDKMYVIRDLYEFTSDIISERVHEYGKQLSFLHSKSIFEEKSWAYVEMIMTTIGSMDSYYYARSQKKELPLPEWLAEKFFMMNLGGEIDFESVRKKTKRLKVLDQDPPIKFRLRKDEQENKYTLSVPAADILEGPRELFVFAGGAVYRCGAALKETLEMFEAYISPARERLYSIAEPDMAVFCGTVLPLLKASGKLDAGKESLEQYEPVPAEFAFYLDERDGEISVKPEVIYGEKRCSLLDTANDGVYRDSMEERRIHDMLAAYFPRRSDSGDALWFPSDEDDRFYRLLSTGVHQMEAEGEVYATDSFKKRKIVNSSRARVGVAVKSGLLELSVHTDGFPREELAGILASYRLRKKYYRMKSGDFLELKDSPLEAVAELCEGLGLDGNQITETAAAVPEYRAFYIDRVLSDHRENLQVDRSREYKAVIRGMKQVEDSDYRIPEGLENVLRSYQRTGYRWLRTLDALGFGGILADDMGLGKTVQVIAFLLAKKQEAVSEESARPDALSLIVCPASLVYNWAREIERFGKGLTVQIIAGNAESRQEMIKAAGGADVWITSYDLLKRDLELYDGLQFGAQVLDEAQNIKNHGTAAAKSVKKIKAGTRFALTGTPIENRLSDLWSIFDFLMPGILGTYEKFKKTYELPIVKSQDEAAAERLKKMVTPFILRRLKKDVLKELPEKTEQVIYVQMEPEQGKIYAASADRLMGMLEKSSEEQVKRQKLQILAELTKLRQICCDPRLLYEDYKQTACKLTACMELVRSAAESGQKVLIFSQFTSVFDILRPMLTAGGMESYLLTGETPKHKRLVMAESFNRDQVPVFLVSLKAGGTGLNLTGASIVIHFDPWWNLAAQNQATDRAHRIGQRQPVTVYRLIARDTIEERILDLQEKKRALAGQVLESENISAAGLTREDLMEILKG